MEQTFRTTLNNIAKTAVQFWTDVPGKVFAFHGEMGAGKTTFIAALCATKGIDEASSPTFSLINEYTYTENDKTQVMYHMDLYRLQDMNEAIQAGVEDALYSGNICLVEWPEKATELLPEDTVHVYIKLISDTERIITTHIFR